MAMLDFGAVRYCSLGADKQKNVYINACSGAGKIFSLGGEGFAQKALFFIHVIHETWNGGGLAKVLFQ